MEGVEDFSINADKNAVEGVFIVIVKLHLNTDRSKMKYVARV